MRIFEFDMNLPAFVFLVFLTTSGASSDQLISVTGTVTDAPMGAVVSSRGARIEATAKLGGPQDHARSFSSGLDERAKFKLSLPAGEYEVCATVPGFLKDCHTIKVEAERVLDFKLKFAPPPGSTFDDMMDIMSSLAGPNGIDCGWGRGAPAALELPLEEGFQDASMACATDAFQQHKSFFVRFSFGTSVEGEMFGGLVLQTSPITRLYSLYVDSLPGTALQIERCPEPMGLYQKGGLLTCSKSGFPLPPSFPKKIEEIPIPKRNK